MKDFFLKVWAKIWVWSIHRSAWCTAKFGSFLWHVHGWQSYLASLPPSCRHRQRFRRCVQFEEPHLVHFCWEWCCDSSWASKLASFLFAFLYLITQVDILAETYWKVHLLLGIFFSIVLQLAASLTPPAGDLAHNPGVCPDQESNLDFWFTGQQLIHRPAVDPLSHTSQG